MAYKRPSYPSRPLRTAKGSGRFFRERQIIIRDGAHVRRLTLRRWHQIAVFFLLVLIAGWGAVATTAFFAGQALVAARNGEINRRVAELDGIKADYRAAFDRLDEFQSLFSSITCEIGSIQNSLLRVADRTVTPDKRGLVPRQAAMAEPGTNCGDGAAPTNVGAAQPATPASGEQSIAPDGTPRFVGTLRSDEQEAVRLRVTQLSTALEKLRQTHGAFLRQSADLTAKRVGDLEKALSRAGVDTAMLAEPETKTSDTGFGTGGPFVPMPQSPASTPGFDPVTLFNNHADRLDNLIVAMRSLPLAVPIEDAEVTSPFGSRDDPFNEQSAFHEGVDFGAPIGTAVQATGDGVVSWSGWRDRYGIMVEIDHGHGLVTRYAHLSRTLVRMGDHVARGRPIGLLGNTGRSTGPHLHYEVRVNDQATDPMKFIVAGRDVLKSE